MPEHPLGLAEPMPIPSLVKKIQKGRQPFLFALGSSPHEAKPPCPDQVADNALSRYTLLRPTTLLSPLPKGRNTLPPVKLNCDSFIHLSGSSSLVTEAANWPVVSEQKGNVTAQKNAALE